MKRRKTTGHQDELRPEYDLRELLRHAVRGKHAERHRQGTNLDVLDPTIARPSPGDATGTSTPDLVVRPARMPGAEHSNATKR